MSMDRDRTASRARALVAGLALAVTGVVPVVAATPASAAPPRPADVQVYPSPGTATISPTQEISFRGASGSALPKVKVTGSSSGAHAGRWVVQSDGRGATWEPSSRFEAGEKVTVSSSVAVAGARGRSFSYRVSRPAPVSPRGVAAAINAADATPAPPAAALASASTASASTASATPAARTKAATTTATANVDSTTVAAPTAPPAPLITRPDLQAPAINTTTPGATAPGLLLATPLTLSSSMPAGTSEGTQITDNNGHLVWFNPVPTGALDLQVINYLGQPALAYHQNLSCGACTTTGFWVVLNSQYKQVATINPANGYQADGHALEISPDGTKALLMAYNPVVVDATAEGGPSNLQVLEGVIQEIDLRTGAMVFEWHSLGTGSDGQQFVPLSDSFVSPSAAPPDDYIHLNSMTYVDNSTILFSARNTSAVYKLSLATGQIEWRLGGQDTRNQFTLTDGDGGPSYAHDVQVLASGSGGSVSRISTYDNGVGRAPSYGRGVAFNLNEGNLTASVAQTWRHNPDLYGFVVGSNRALPNGDQLVSYGNTGYADEFNSSGQVVWASQTEVSGAGPSANQIWTYRTLRADWHATPQTPPAVVVSHSSPTAVTVTASWNGATDVTGWQLYAGPNGNSLRQVATAPKTNFETSINANVQASDTAFQMRAVNAAGTVIGASPLSDDAIAAHYQALGGASSFLGTATGSEQGVGSGLTQTYQGGNIYWSPATGAFSVRGNILAHYLALGGPTGVLGFPTSDEQGAGSAGADGHLSTFQVGNIYFSDATNAQEVQGVILSHYLALGGPSGVLGFPTGDEQASSPSGVGGRFSPFQVGNIYFSPPTGAFEVQGAILAHYVAIGGPLSVVGFPLSDEAPTLGAGGRFNNFQIGVIDWSPGTGAWEVQGAILSRYLSAGGTGSSLGFPTSDEFGPGPNLRQSNFSFGHFILFSFVDGSTQIH